MSGKRTSEAHLDDKTKKTSDDEDEGEEEELECSKCGVVSSDIVCCEGCEIDLCLGCTAKLCTCANCTDGADACAWCAKCARKHVGKKK